MQLSKNLLPDGLPTILLQQFFVFRIVPAQARLCIAHVKDTESYNYCLDNTRFLHFCRAWEAAAYLNAGNSSFYTIELYKASQQQFYVRYLGTRAQGFSSDIEFQII